jgi:hypothetical protein
MRLTIASTLTATFDPDKRAWMKDLASLLAQDDHQVEFLRLPFTQGDLTEFAQSFFVTRHLVLENIDRLIVIDREMLALQHNHKIACLEGNLAEQQSQIDIAKNSFWDVCLSECKRIIAFDSPASIYRTDLIDK